MLQTLNLFVIAKFSLFLIFFLKYQSSDLHQCWSMMSMQSGKNEYFDSFNNFSYSFALTFV